MAFHNLTNVVKTIVVSTGAVAGTTEVDATGVDMTGYDGVRFLADFGTITSGAVTSLKGQQSSDDGSTDSYGDIAGSNVTVADTDDNKVAILDIYRPQKRYVRPVVLRATQNAVLNCIIAELYLASDAAVAKDTTVLGQTLLQNPAEGTP